jgi:hypothetical protein
MSQIGLFKHLSLICITAASLSLAACGGRTETDAAISTVQDRMYAQAQQQGAQQQAAAASAAQAQGNTPGDRAAADQAAAMIAAAPEVIPAAETPAPPAAETPPAN